MIWNFLKTVGKAVTEAAKLILPRTISYVADAVIAIVENNEVLAEQYEDIQLAQLKLQYLQHHENLDFQAELAKFNQEKTQELQEFIQLAEDIRLEKQQDFQRWCLEQEKYLQLELLERNHTLQRELVAYQRQTSLKIIEEQKRLENSPIWLVASDILNSHPEDELIPLRVFFAPPKLQFERFASATHVAKEFPDIELTLAEGLRQFFRHYSASGRNIDFLAGAWVSKSFHSEASIKSLFSVLKSEPTLVLESEVDGDYLNFRLAYWGLNWSKYRYEPVISRLPYQEILYEAAKTRARNWQKTREKLVAAGEKGEDVDKLYGGDNVINLATLQREEKFKQAGIDIGELELNYIVNKKDFEELYQFLIIYHCLFAGLVTDEYFLVQYNLPPLLPILLPDLTKNVPDTEVVEEIVQSVILYYQNLYQALETERSSFIPELSLDLAQNLLFLPNKSWAKQQTIHSLKAWLKLRDLPQLNEFTALVDAIKSALIIEDIEYVEKLNECLAVLGYDTWLSVEDACYNRGMICCEGGNYEAAISDFDRAIELNSDWAEAYYNRGLAYAKLKQYQEAIEDYTKALQINNNWADTYNNRGNAYYKLGNHEQAIADYNQALSINPNYAEAEKNRDIVQGVLEELKRKQQEEEKHKCKLENFSVVYTLQGHSSNVCCLAISPDSKILASSSYDDTIKLWELNTGKIIRTLTGHTKDVEAVYISPDGKILVSGSDDHTVKLWDLKTGQEIKTLIAHLNCVRCVAISPDGKLLASGDSQGYIKLWELPVGSLLGTRGKHSGLVRCLAFSADGQILASGSADKTIKLWKLSNLEEEITLTGHSATVKAIVFSPDGQTIFSGSDDKTIKQWQLLTGGEIRSFTAHSSWIYSLAISSDGETLVSSSGDNTIKIWQLSTGQELKTLTAHSNSVITVAISPDGQTLVSGSIDKTIKIWRTQ